MSGRQSPTKSTPRPTKPPPSTATTPAPTPGPSTPFRTPMGTTPAGTPKAIGNLAKKSDAVTRQGTTKWKFAPVLPSTPRTKPAEVKNELESATPGRGRGGTPRGRGRGRGGAETPRVPVEMVASGPFAMGPAMSGSFGRRAAPRSNFAPVAPPGTPISLGAGLSRTAAPTLKREHAAEPGTGNVAGHEQEDDVEVYSDPDEGVEIVDMEDVRQMDWMAPESLKRERQDGKKKKKDKLLKIKKEETAVSLKGKGRAMDVDADDVDALGKQQGVNLANALDLSESEEEEELETLIEDFANLAAEEDPDIRQERMYFFQFPNPFPTFTVSEPLFIPETSTPPDGAPMDTDGPEPSASAAGDKDKGKRRVSFAADVKPPAPTPPQGVTPAPGETEGDGETAKDKEQQEQAPPRVDGVIGQLEVYKSGAVKLRLGNGLLYDVSAATQPSFLQHAVYVSPKEQRLCVLGEVNRRFVVSPNIDALLESVEKARRKEAIELEDEGLFKMDTS